MNKTKVRKLSFIYYVTVHDLRPKKRKLQSIDRQSNTIKYQKTPKKQGKKKKKKGRND